MIGGENSSNPQGIQHDSKRAGRAAQSHRLRWSYSEQGTRRRRYFIKKIIEKLDPLDFSAIIFTSFAVVAFFLQSPVEILKGLIKITFSTCLLMTDFIAVGGIGATLINASLTGLNSYLFLKAVKAHTNGSTIMAIWLIVGFSFFGKNLINTIPILIGVLLCAKLQKEPVRNYSLIALLSSTLAPAVSQVAFGRYTTPALDILLAAVLGIVIGLIMPSLSSTTIRFHNGYDLFNAGFAGGILAIFILAYFQFLGIDISSANILSSGNNSFMAPFLICIMLSWIIIGVLTSNKKSILPTMKDIMSHPGRLVTDYYLLYGNPVYINMGLLGLLGISVTLLMGAELNGIAIAGVFTIAGFGAFGKHPKNITPVIIGAVSAAVINPVSPSDPGNVGAVLFSTGLAPIAGQFGLFWGMIAGFLHVSINLYMGIITGGTNLYNNGFTAGFVAILMVPLLLSLRNLKSKGEGTDEKKF